MPHNVLAIANEFISRADVADMRLTPMHVQKLCYFAHGFNLAITDAPLTNDRVEAWEFGPVFPTLYDALKRYGAGEVGEQIRERNWAAEGNARGNVVSEVFSQDEQEVIEGVLETYGDFEAYKLSALTHEAGSPWEKTYRPGRKNLLIPNNLIKDYFCELAATPA
jgi:uncharacterized phage-associated protein